MRLLVLFDIDGTLISSAASGSRALRAVFARDYSDLGFFEGIRLDGKTDPQIVRELYTAAGHAHLATDENIQRLLSEYIGELERELAARRHLVRTHPGIPELLASLATRDGVMVGLLTGNVVPGARMKLTAAGIDFDGFTVGAFGSDSAHRPDLPSIAAARAAARFGHTPRGHEVVIIGDTPADVTCGASIGARAVAVATGSYTVGDLNSAGAHAAFANFAETARVLEAIGA